MAIGIANSPAFGHRVRPWLPSALSPHLWLRADLGTIYDGSGNLTSWMDPRGTWTFSQSTEGKRPALQPTGGPGSTPAINFSVAGGKTLSCADFVDPATQYVVAVLVQRSLGVAQQLLAGAGNANICEPVQGGVVTWYNSGRLGTQPAKLGAQALSWHAKPAELTVERNGGATETIATANITTTGTRTKWLGSNQDVGGYCELALAELIMLDHSPSASEVAYLRAYLIQRYGPSVVWSPLDTMPRLWLQSDLGVTAPGNAVEAWADQGALGTVVTQTVAGSKPTLGAATGPNGGPAIAFDGSADFLDAGFAATASQAYTAIAVLRDESAGNGNRGLFCWTTAAGNAGIHATTGGAGDKVGVLDGAWRQGPVHVPNDWQMLAWRLDADAALCTLYRDNVVAGSVAYTKVGMPIAGVGWVGQDVWFGRLQGKLALCALWDVAVPLPTMTAFWDWAKGKYGL